MADVIVDTSGFDDAAARYARAMDKTLRTWAFEVERRAKRKSPVDTGFNKNTIYTVTPDGRMAVNNQQVSQRPGKRERAGKRKSYKPGQFAEQAPLTGNDGSALANILGSIPGSVQLMGGSGGISATRPAPDALSAEVRVGSNYALYLEMGTFRMRARPFLGPAAAEVTPMVDAILRKNLRAEGLL